MKTTTVRDRDVMARYSDQKYAKETQSNDSLGNPGGGLFSPGLSGAVRAQPRDMRERRLLEINDNMRRPRGHGGRSGRVRFAERSLCRRPSEPLQIACTRAPTMPCRNDRNDRWIVRYAIRSLLIALIAYFQAKQVKKSGVYSLPRSKYAGRE